MVVSCRRRRPLRAFTLTEVVTVLVLLGILSGIGAVTFGAFFGAATDTAAAGRLDVAHAAELRFASTWGRFTPHPADLADDIGVVVVTGPATGEQVSVAVGTSGALVLATATSDGCVARRYPGPDDGFSPVSLEYSAPCAAVTGLASGDTPRDPDVSARW